MRLADALDYEHGGRRLVELADRLGRSESAMRQRASKLRLVRDPAAAADRIDSSSRTTPRRTRAGFPSSSPRTRSRVTKAAMPASTAAASTPVAGAVLRITGRQPIERLRGVASAAHALSAEIRTRTGPARVPGHGHCGTLPSPRPLDQPELSDQLPLRQHVQHGARVHGAVDRRPARVGQLVALVRVLDLQLDAHGVWRWSCHLRPARARRLAADERRSECDGCWAG